LLKKQKTIKFIKPKKQIKEVNKNKMDLNKKSALAITLFLILLFGGTFVYSYIEGWKYIDSAYFTVATVTTIGYGDIVPQTDAGKIFTIFFSFLGIGMAFYFLTSLGKYIYKKTFHDKLKKHQNKLIKHIKSDVHKNRKLKKR